MAAGNSPAICPALFSLLSFELPEDEGAGPALGGPCGSCDNGASLSPVPAMRLDRFLSQACLLTRREAQGSVRSGEARVDGVTVLDPAWHIRAAARVEWRGKALAHPRPRYLMLNKPPGVVCAAHDREHRTVLDLVDDPGRANLHVAGRLDLDATGLVLLTDDGDWSHRVTSPRHKVPKTYRVMLAEPLAEPATGLLRAGIPLRGEPQACAPAVLESVSATEWLITVTEGKYHQVKRMFAAAGNRVLHLHRLRIGAVELDPALAAGAWRELSETEAGSFR